MIETISLIIFLIVSIVVNIGGWLFFKRYCQTAVEYLSNHPRLDFIIHVFTGLGSGWLISLWMPKKIALILGSVLITIAAIMYYVVPPEKLPKHIKSSGMGRGLPVGFSAAWLSYPWMPEILTLILGAISMVGAETVHYVFPNLVITRGGRNEKI